MARKFGTFIPTSIKFSNIFLVSLIIRQAKVNQPKSNKENKVVHALTVEEQEAFTNWLVDKPIDEFKYRNVYLLQMYTGLRVGESLALTTHDIDLKNKRLNISRTLTTDEKGNIIMWIKPKHIVANELFLSPTFFVLIL